MADVVLREINKEIWMDAMNLVLRLEQGGLVAPNFYRIPEFKAEPSFMQLAIYNAENELVGFSMYGLDPDDGNWWIYRLMIDERYQRRGYGKAALDAVINEMSKIPGCSEIFVGYRPDNNVAAAMFHSFGFHRTGQMLQGEFIAKLDITEQHAEV